MSAHAHRVGETMSFGKIIGLYLCGLVSESFALSPVREFLQQNRLEEALPYCRQFEVLSTVDNENYLACAWVYYRTDRVDSADTILQKLKSAYATPEYQILLGFSKMKKKQYEEAKQILTTVQNEHKKSAVALTAQELYAEVYETMGQLGTAAFIYKKIVDEDKKRARAHWGLARHYLARGENGRAIFHFEQTALLWPKHIGSRFNLGALHLSGNNIAEASKWLSECYKLDKADAGVLEYLGLLFEKKGLYNEAVKYWERAIEVKKDASIAKERLGVLYSKVIDQAIEMTDYNRALTYLDAYHGLIPDQPRMRLQRGIIYRNMGNYERASGELLAYLGNHPNDAKALREMGICYLNMKLVHQAGSYFAKALTQEPDEGVNHAWMAFVLESKGEIIRARDEWRRATELLKDPEELAKAARRLATIEKKLQKDRK